MELEGGGIITNPGYLGTKLSYFTESCIAYDLQVDYITAFNETVTVYKVAAAVVAAGMTAYGILKNEAAEAGRRDAYIAIKQSQSS